MAKVSKENSYLIAEGEGGELYIFLEAKHDTPDSPKIIYDGNDHAIFVRNQEQNIILDYVHPEVRDKLRKAYEVIVVETILENIKDSYYVDIQHVDKIPLDWSKYGLKSWEDVVLEH